MVRCHSVFVFVHQNEKSWPKPKLNKIKHWVEVLILIAVFCIFTPMYFAHCFHHCINYKAKICFLLISLAFQRKKIYYITTIKKYLTLNIFVHSSRYYSNKAQFNIKLKSSKNIFETPFLNQACDWIKTIKKEN